MKLPLCCMLEQDNKKHAGIMCEQFYQSGLINSSINPLTGTHTRFHSLGSTHWHYSTHGHYGMRRSDWDTFWLGYISAISERGLGMFTTTFSTVGVVCLALYVHTCTRTPGHCVRWGALRYFLLRHVGQLPRLGSVLILCVGMAVGLENFPP